MRTLTTNEQCGTTVMHKKTGNIVGEIVGTYTDGYLVRMDEDSRICRLPFGDVGFYYVEA